MIRVAFVYENPPAFPDNRLEQPPRPRTDILAIPAPQTD